MMANNLEFNFLFEGASHSNGGKNVVVLFLEVVRLSIALKSEYDDHSLVLVGILVSLLLLDDSNSGDYALMGWRCRSCWL